MTLLPTWIIILFLPLALVMAAFSFTSVIFPYIGSTAIGCTLLSPIAGLAYRFAPLAPRNGGVQRRRWIVGTAAAALLGVPRLYLMMRVYGKNWIGIEMISCGYHTLYCSWYLVLVPYLFWVILSPIVVDWSNQQTTILGICVLTIVNVLSCMSRRALKRSFASDNLATESKSGLNGAAYLQPFIASYCAILLTAVVWWAAVPLNCTDLNLYSDLLAVDRGLWCRLS